MIRHCNAADVVATVFAREPCGATYDDLDHSTVCPHDPLGPKIDLAAMEVAARSLVTDPTFLERLEETTAEVTRQVLERGYAELDLGDGLIVEYRP